MIDALVLGAVARAVDQGGDVDSAYAAIGRADPLLRGAARRRLRTAHADALLATREQRADEGRHALRLTYLIIAGLLPGEAERDDVGAIEAAFAEARATRPPPRGRFWATGGVLALIVAASLGGVAATRWMGNARGLPEGAIDRPAPTRGAFTNGGVPAPLAGDAVIRRVLGKDVPDFVIALDRLSRAQRGGASEADRAAIEAEIAAARGRALDAEAAAALGEAPARAVAALLDAARAAADPKAGEAAGDALAEATSALDDALAAEGAGYFADGDVIIDGTGRRMVIVYTFAVEKVSVFSTGEAGSDRVRALHVRRLDKLNWSHALLGFSRPRLRSAAVLLDQLDEQTLGTYGPALAKDGSLRLFDDDAEGIEPADRTSVEARAGEIARASYGALPSLAGAADLGDVLLRRRTVLEALEKRADARGLTLVIPGSLRLPEGFADQLRGLADRREIADLDRADRALGELSTARTFFALRDAVASSVERHEVQHRLDARRPLAMPKVLEERVGPVEKDGRDRRHASNARAELSAYLAELARDPIAPRVGLGMIARFLFQRRAHGTPESYAALTILEGLAAELGAPRDPLVVRSVVDRRAAGRLYLALGAHPDDRLRAAAKRLWEQLFGAKLPDLRPAPPLP